MLPLNLHHTAVAVRDLDAALDTMRLLFGIEAVSREVVAEQGVEEAMVPFGASYLQFLMPLAADTAVGRFLERRGEGLHHVAIQVTDLDAALAHLVSVGADLIDREPRTGGGGHRIAFVHPRALAGTLIELVEVH